MKNASDNPQHNVGRDVKTGKHELDTEKREAKAATTGEGLARSGGTPDEQITTGSYHAGGTKITSEEQGKVDAHGSAGASGPPGSSHRPEKKRD